MNNNLCLAAADQFSMLGGECRLAFPPLTDTDQSLTTYDWEDCVGGKMESKYSWCSRRVDEMQRRYYWSDDSTTDSEECIEYGLVCNDPPPPPPRKRWFNRTRLLLAA